MKLHISDAAVSSLVKLAVTARVIHGVIIDMPELYNAGWLSILLGGLLALPLTFCVSRFRLANGCRPALHARLIRAAFFLFFAWDAAAVTSAIADAASFMALNSTAAVYLMIPQLILCLWCLRLGGNAIGSGAGIWNRILPWLLMIVVILQFKDYRPQWLTPVLGPGIPSLLDGALKAAGWFSLPAALFLVSDSDGSPKAHLRPLKALGASVGLSAAVCILFSMMTPSLPDEKLATRAFRLDALLANGRTGLALQFPTIALWFLSLFHTLLFDAFSACIMLQGVFPGWSRSTNILNTLAVGSLIAVSRFSEKTFSLTAASWLFPAIGTLLVILMLSALKSKEANKHA